MLMDIYAKWMNVKSEQSRSEVQCNFKKRLASKF